MEILNITRQATPKCYNVGIHRVMTSHVEVFNIDPMLRWKESKQLEIDLKEQMGQAAEIAAEIAAGAYDGFKAKHPSLAGMTAFYLATLAEAELWTVYAEDTRDDEGPVYSVWVER